MDGVVDNIKRFSNGVKTVMLAIGYQQYDKDIHKFNDTVLVGVDACAFLRANLQQHILLEVDEVN